MAWSFDISTDVGRVRFHCGDTDTNDQLIQNEDIAYLLTDAGNNIYRAAANACRAIAAKLYNSLALDEAPGSVSYDPKERADGFMKLAASLDQKAATSGSSNVGAGIFAGGISKADKETREQDADRVAPAFSIGLHSEDLNCP